MLTMQELFNTQAEFPAEHQALLGRFNRLWEKHDADLYNGRFTAAYYRDLQDIADLFDVDFKVPTKIGALQEVETNPTLH